MGPGQVRWINIVSISLSIQLYLRIGATFSSIHRLEFFLTLAVRNSTSQTAIMGGIHMYQDLPRIDFPDIEYRSGQIAADELDIWPSLNHQDSAIGFSASRELDFPSHQFPLMPSMQRYASQEHSATTSSFSWMVDLPRNRSHPMPSQYEGLNPVPYNLAIPRDASPDGWWGGERPAIEQDSSSGGSAWSPRTSEGRSEIGAGSLRRFSPWNEFQTTSATFLPGSSTFPKHVAYQSPRPASGIALSEIQQYPDLDSDELLTKPLQDMKRDNPFFLESGGIYQSRAESIHYVQEDEGIGSSIQEDDDDLPMEDDLQEDNASDYTPVGVKRGHRRNISRSTAASSRAPAVASPASKRPTRPRKLSSIGPKPNSKVSKHTHAKALAPTPSPTSPTPPQKSGRSQCFECSRSFSSASALHKHTLASHTRPFACSFHRYGCSSTFGSKNEWKRHVSSQHLRLGIYRCDIGQCVPQPKANHQRRKSSASGTYVDALKAAAAISSARNGANAKDVTSYNDFNRKDLFTQHVRRMHGPPPSASRVEKDSFDDSLETIRERCWILLRDPPPHSRCGFCCNDDRELGDATETGVVFEGNTSWDERMEHVGKHLEKGEDISLEREDVMLRDWMVHQDLMSREGAGWKVVGCGTRRRGKGVSGDGDEDAEADDA